MDTMLPKVVISFFKDLDLNLNSLSSLSLNFGVKNFSSCIVVKVSSNLFF